MVEMPVIHGADHFPFDDFLHLLQIDNHPGNRVRFTGYADFDHVVVPMSMA